MQEYSTQPQSSELSPDVTVPSLPNPPKKPRHSTLTARVVAALLVGVIVGGAGVHLYQENMVAKAPTSIDTPLQTQSENVTPTIEILPTSALTSGIFTKKLFSPQDTFISDKPLPLKIISLTDAQLVGLQCSEYYLGDITNGFTATLKESSKSLTDPQMLAFVKANPSTNAISKCETETGKTIIHYEVQAGGGGSGNVAYFGQITSAGEVSNPVAIPNDGAAYFACQKPYALTTSNLFYYGCGGGDGGGGQVSAYEIDLNVSKATLLQKCYTTTMDLPGGRQEADITCE